MSRLESIKSKIVSLEDAQRRVNMWRLKSDKIVFTNGCFDLLHEGHVTYLAKAAEEGNRLVLALNTDASVKRQGKGVDRPINGESSRAIVLAALGFVDLVVLFDQDTPLEMIEFLKPDILVKGADYDPSERNPNSKKYIVGSDVVLDYGGEVKSIELVDGFSTTAILAKARK
ncbi:MAG: adenylyltransferase/cytidyltransferase family protein [Flavobacteriia bacterium]|jgi:rfaE bifunctional protein nucleotidyltransferase chain/domain